MRETERGSYLPLASLISLGILVRSDCPCLHGPPPFMQVPHPGPCLWMLQMLAHPPTPAGPGQGLSALQVYSRSDSCKFLKSAGSRMLTRLFPAKVTALITGLSGDAQT